MPNRLAEETSPYLLQHAENPVDWFPWGDEAFERAKAEDKPIFLSVGYSACHWCHVMEHESFENPEIAQLMNEHFINVKVDREERPDIDQIYMHAVQFLTRQGGWPMSVFLTPDLKPFYAGTYYPPQRRMRMAGFNEVLMAISDAWDNRKDQAIKQSEEITEAIANVGKREKADVELDFQILHTSAIQLERTFDKIEGGFGKAPKFPHSMDLRVLLRYWKHRPIAAALDIVRHTCEKMARGGLYDQLGGGFHRYSVDEKWLVPHFEKMLYDNGLMTLTYLEAYQATGDDYFKQIVSETLDYVLREMTDSDGGFYSTQDADSEGVEGKFYVWSPKEVMELLGEDAGNRFCKIFDVTQTGNFEGHSILHLDRPIKHWAEEWRMDLAELNQEIANSKAKLIEARNQRIWPGKDDKILVSWNALVIDALAMAGQLLNEPKYQTAAEEAANFILEKMVRDDQRLLHSSRHGVARFDAYLDDYTYMIRALISLYQSTFKQKYLLEAKRLADITLEFFADHDEQAGFFYTAEDHEQLITRQKDSYDNAVPSGNGMAAYGFLQLGALLGDPTYTETGYKIIKLYGSLMKDSPLATAQLQLAFDFYFSKAYEIVIIEGENGPRANEVIDLLNEFFLPNKVIAAKLLDSEESDLAIFKEKTALNDETTVYVCRNFACSEPLQGKDAIRAKFSSIDQAAVDQEETVQNSLLK